MSQPIRGQGGHLVFPIGPKNTNLVEDVEILLPVKFRWIPFSCFRGEVENVSANRRPGRPSCFSYRPDKHKLDRGCWDLASCQVSLISVQRFQRRSRIFSANQRPGRPSCFSDRPEKHKLGRGRWDLASCQVLLNSVQPFQRRSWKCLSQSEARASLRESLYFSQDIRSGKILHLTRPHQVLPDWSVLIYIKIWIFHQTTGPVCGFF